MHRSKKLWSVSILYIRLRSVDSFDNSNRSVTFGGAAERRSPPKTPRFCAATDRGKADPTDLRRRHRPAEHGEPARTGPWNSRSAARHRSRHRTASRERPPPLSRTASTASSMSRRGRALMPRAACSERRDRSTSRICESGCRLRGEGLSTPGPHGCEPPDIPPHRAAVEIAPGSCQEPVRQPDTVGRPVRPTHACTGVS